MKAVATRSPEDACMVCCLLARSTVFRRLNYHTQVHCVVYTRHLVRFYVTGEKHWKIHAPASEEATLPRYSSNDFDGSLLGEPLAEITLRAGDLLYLPRGYIHQARTLETAARGGYR